MNFQDFCKQGLGCTGALEGVAAEGTIRVWSTLMQSDPSPICTFSKLYTMKLVVYIC